LNALSQDYGRKLGEPAAGHVDERYRMFRQQYRARVSEDFPEPTFSASN
jgi:hypothetical protein